MANALPDDFDIQGDGFMDAKMLRTLALVVAMFLWVLAMWFFMVTLIAVSHYCKSTSTQLLTRHSGYQFMGRLLSPRVVGNGLP